MASRWLSVVSALAIAGSAAACGEGLGPNADAAPVSLASGSSNEQRAEIQLTAAAGFPDAGGKARFRDRGGEREIQIGVEDAPTNVQVSFVVGGDVVGTGMTDAFGDAKINLNSDRGDNVPLSVAGLSVAVQTAEGAVIVSGAFGS